MNKLHSLALDLADFIADYSPLIFLGCIVLMIFAIASAIGLASAGTTEAIQHLSRY